MKKNIILGILIILITAGGYGTYMHYINSFSMSNTNVKKKDISDSIEKSRDMTAMEHAYDSHVHEPVPTDDYDAIPSLSLGASYDGLGGINLELKTQNFVFAPQKVNTLHVPGEGHAHLFINDTKITRIYSPYHYVSSDFLPVGKNVIRVELNANSHGNYTYEGEVIYDTIDLEVSPREPGEGGSPW